MAAKTTAAAGDWNTGATWTGGLKPVNGDTVTINHAVTVTTTEIVGVSPAAGAATPALQLNADLTVTGFLTCRGDVAMNTGGLIGAGVGVFEFDAHLAGTPSTAIYLIRSTNLAAGSGVVSIVGTSPSSRFTLRSNAGGANGRIKYLETGAITVENCDLQRIGDASNTAYAGGAHNGQLERFANITLDANCGNLGDNAVTGAQPGAFVQIINVTHRGAGAWIGESAPTTGTRTMSGCRWAGQCRFSPCTGWNISDTIFENSYDVTGGPWASWTNNIDAIPQADPGDHFCGGDYTDSIVLRLGTPANPHGIGVNTTLAVTIDGVFFDYPDGTDGAGDMITFSNPASPTSYVVKRCIVGKSTAAASAAGTMISLGGGTNVTVSVEHCTYYANFGVYVGEAYVGRANMVSSVRGNIAIGDGGAARYKVHMDGANPGTVDMVSAANADYNCGFGLQAGSKGQGYNTPMSNTPGQHDQDCDPQFVDSTRTIKSWDTLNGGPGTAANAIAEMRKKNDATGYNSNYDFLKYLTYIRAGFTPQNPQLMGTAHDSTTIGAIQVSLPNTVKRRRLSRLQRAG